MRVTAVIFSLACALGLTSAIPFGFTPPNATIVECGPPTDLLKIKYVYLNPNPPVKGKVLTIDAKGFLSDRIIEGATIDIIVKMGVVKLLTKTFDFCEESVKVDKPCPLEAGDHYLNHSVELPKEIPPGKYTVNVKVRNPPKEDEKLGQEITCLNVVAVFGV
ncbi:Phosphatidylglycerol/phosphatidylinositol transfer protein [Entomortierella lignicola]|nr:Phosphatidylglycerol/phosphatidylinositol transfer protein [Entomortierella lignicola]